jgi:hypothetical protein
VSWARPSAAVRLVDRPRGGAGAVLDELDGLKRRGLVRFTGLTGKTTEMNGFAPGWS